MSEGCAVPKDGESTDPMKTAQIESAYGQGLAVGRLRRTVVGPLSLLLLLLLGG